MIGNPTAITELAIKEFLRNVQSWFFNSPKMENSLENGNLLLRLKGISIIVKDISPSVVLENSNQHMASFGSSRIDKYSTTVVII